MSFDWDTKKLAEVTTLISRGITPSYAEESTVLVLNQRCIRNNQVTFEHARFTDPLKKRISADKLLKNYDILVNSTGVGTLGRIAQIKEVNASITVDSHVTIVRPNFNVDPVFLGYSLYNQQSLIESMGEGSTGQTELSRIRLAEEINVPMPSMIEQKIIGNLFLVLDKKIELNNAINKNLEEMAQVLFKRWFVDFEFPNENGEPYKSSGGELEESELGLIPKGWKVGIATDIFNVQSGGTPKTGISEYWNGEIPFFTPKDTTNSFHVIDTEKKVTDEGLSKCNSKLYEMGTVFITARGTVGKLAIAGRDMAMNQSCYALVSKNGYTQKYIFLQTQQLINTIKKSATGAVFDAITVSTFQSLKTIIPNLDLVMRFDNIVEGIFSSLLNNANENQILSNLRDTLLPKLMSGEIRVPVEREYTQAVDLPMVAESSEKYNTH